MAANKNDKNYSTPEDKPAGNTAAIELINQAVAKKDPTIAGAGRKPTINDLFDFTPTMSESERRMYDNQRRYQNGATGALPNETYFPAASHQIGVGGYSGSQIGSTTLFAPSALVPFGIYDAREKAMQNAAQQHAKSIDDFYKSQKAPLTKRTAVNAELDNQYYEGLQKWTDTAQKRYGDRWAEMLPQDISFQKWNKSFETTKAMEDDIVNHVAEVEEAAKTGKFDLSPETIDYMNKVKTGYGGLQNPFDANGHNLSDNASKLKASYNFDMSLNEALEHFKPQINEKLETNFRSGNTRIDVIKKETMMTDDQAQNLAEQIHKSRYAGDSMYTVEDIKKGLLAKNEKQVERQYQHYVDQFKPDKENGLKKEDVEASFNNTTGFNVTTSNTKTLATPEDVQNGAEVDEQGYIVAPRQKAFTSKGFLAFNNDYSGPITLSEDMVDLSTNKRTDKSGVPKKAVISGIGVVPVYKKSGKAIAGAKGTLATDEDIKKMEEKGLDLSEFIEYIPGVSLSYEETDEEGAKAGTRSLMAPLEKVESMIATEKNAIDGYKKKAAEATAELKGRSKKTVTKAPDAGKVEYNGQEYTVAELKSAGWSDAAISKHTKTK